MIRGEVYISHVGRKRRPVLVLTRSEVLEVRSHVTVAEITSRARGLAAEVELDHEAVGLSQPSYVNCDGLHTVAQTTLVDRVGLVDELTMERVCRSVVHAISC